MAKLMQHHGYKCSGDKLVMVYITDNACPYLDAFRPIWFRSDVEKEVHKLIAYCNAAGIRVIKCKVCCFLMVANSGH